MFPGSKVRQVYRADNLTNILYKDYIIQSNIIMLKNSNFIHIFNTYRFQIPV
jgi:hypothetical protein